MSSLTTRHYVEAIFGGRFADAGVSPPVLEPEEREEIARQMRVSADRPSTYPDPREWVVALGLRVTTARALGACGGELTDGNLIAYKWDPCQRIRGARVAHGLAHAALVAYGGRHSEADAWLLTAELLAPARAARDGSLFGLAMKQAHAPVWLLDAWRSGCKFREMHDFDGEIATA